MTKLDARIEQLKKFKEYFYTTDKPGADIKSFFQLLDYHIAALEEIRELVNAFERDDVEYISKWFEKRSK